MRLVSRCNALNLTVEEGDFALNCSASTACYDAAIRVEEGDSHALSSNMLNTVWCTESNSCEHLALDVGSLSHSRIVCHDCSYVSVRARSPTQREPELRGVKRLRAPGGAQQRRGVAGVSARRELHQR